MKKILRRIAIDGLFAFSISFWKLHLYVSFLDMNIAGAKISAKGGIKEIWEMFYFKIHILWGTKWILQFYIREKNENT